MLTEQAAREKARDWLDGSSLSLESLVQLLLTTDREAREAEVTTDDDPFKAVRVSDGWEVVGLGYRIHCPYVDIPSAEDRALSLAALMSIVRRRALSPFRAANLVAPDGGPRPICGEEFVPVTADGAIVIPGLSVVYHPKEGAGDTEVSGVDGVVGTFSRPSPTGTTWHEFPVSQCYSTPEAAASALAARGEVEG